MARVPLLTREDLQADKKEFFDQIAALRGHVARPFSALLNSPDIAASIARVGDLLRYTSPTIPEEIREITTLTTAIAFNCQYLWTHHVGSAEQAGISEEVIRIIRDEPTPRKLLPKQAVFVQFTRELIERKKVRDSTYSAVDHLLGQTGTVDLIITIGYYSMLCIAINALEVELEEDVSPLLPS